MLLKLLKHIAEANQDADRFFADGCFGLARCRRRDARFLRQYLAEYVTMAKKPHPVEAFEADIIEHAVSWTAFQFRGRGMSEKFEGLTRAEAESAAHCMLAQRGDRPVMIYAINAAGRQALADTISLG